MKKFLAISFLLSIACIVAGCSVTDGKPTPIIEQPDLRPIDPQPIAVAFTVSDDAPVNPKNKIEPKDWQFTNAEYLPDGILEMSAECSVLSHSFPIQPGCYYFQIDQKTIGGAGMVAVGNASFGFLHDVGYANANRDWMTFSHFFRIPEMENQMQISVKQPKETGWYWSSEGKAQFKNLQIIPAQSLLNLAPKGQPLRDGDTVISRAEPTGEFLPLGRMERIEQDYKTKQSVYHFYLEDRWGTNSPDPWNISFGANREKIVTKLPSVSLEAGPIEKRVGEPIHGSIDRLDEMILKFELRPISIGINGEFQILPPIRFLSGRLQGTWIDNYQGQRDNIFWSTDGKTWNALKLKATIVNDRWTDYPPALPTAIFPCERFYLKFKPIAKDDSPSRILSHLGWLRVHAVLDTDQYHDYGRTSYFRVVPGETEESGMKVNPLYTARNQVYFLFRNETDTEQQPKFSARLGYYYAEPRGQTNTPFGAEFNVEPKDVRFRASGNTVQTFDGMTCRWEVLGNADKIPPGEERICVFTLEAERRSGRHFQSRPYVSDTFDVEFDLGTYKMLNKQMLFFPPRLAIE
jgi:hypothetical protein